MIRNTPKEPYKGEEMKFIMTVIVLIFTTYAMLMYMGIHEAGTRTFVGEQEFTTISDASEFQMQIAKEAELVGAEIETLSLTKQSPPIVNYRIIMPATKVDIFGDISNKFKYGEQWETNKNAKVSNIIALILMPLMMIGFVYAVFSKKVSEYLNRNQ